MLLILVLFIILSGCSLNGDESNVENSQADYVKYNSHLYLKAIEMIVQDPTQLSKIDTVNEASRIPENTPIYKINGYSDSNIIAVKDDNNLLEKGMKVYSYSVYLKKDLDVQSEKLNFSEQKIESIDVYKEGKFLRTLKGEQGKDFIALINDAKGSKHIDINNAEKYSIFYKFNSPIILKYDVLQDNNEYVLANNDLLLPLEVGDYLK